MHFSVSHSFVCFIILCSLIPHFGYCHPATSSQFQSNNHTGPGTARNVQPINSSTHHLQHTATTRSNTTPQPITITFSSASFAQQNQHKFPSGTRSDHQDNTRFHTSDQSRFQFWQHENWNHQDCDIFCSNMPYQNRYPESGEEPWRHEVSWTSLHRPLHSRSITDLFVDDHLNSQVSTFVSLVCTCILQCTLQILVSSCRPATVYLPLHGNNNKL